MGVKAHTIRFPEQISRKGAALAKRGGISFNEFVIESVEERLRKEEDRELGEAFDLLGQHAEMNDVEYALPAINEVLETNDQ